MVGVFEALALGLSVIGDRLSEIETDVEEINQINQRLDDQAKEWMVESWSQG